ncbi:MAG: RNA-binding protein [Clostridiales bacterium]|nr:RNA-binding protein [Clostridiales bacterium]MDN5282433.1 RNA-binding protein [Candidatus Ozemobacter sp.]
MKLSSNQRKFLEALANKLSPIIRIGKQGLESKIVSSVNEAFNSNELIKIKILDSAPVTAQEVAEAAIAGSGAELVRIIGRVVLLYKPFKDKPRKIELPNPKS